MSLRLAAATAGVLACTPDVELARIPLAAAPPDARAPRWAAVESGTGADLLALSGSAANNVWAVGAGGVALRFDGAAWRATSTGVAIPLTGVWTAHEGEAWAVGTGGDNNPVVLRWDGARWTPQRLPMRTRTPLRAVWGATLNDVWIVGGSPDIMEAAAWRWDGATWRPEFMMGMRPPSLSAVGGRDTNDVWAFGNGGAAWHRRGGLWSFTPPPFGTQLAGAACVTRGGEAWAAAVGAGALRYLDAWSPATPGFTPRGLWCGASEVWAVGDGGRAARWEGGAWRPEVSAPTTLTAVWSDGAGAVWAAGPRGTLARLER